MKHQVREQFTHSSGCRQKRHMADGNWRKLSLLDCSGDRLTWAHAQAADVLLTVFIKPMEAEASEPPQRRRLRPGDIQG